MRLRLYENYRFVLYAPFYAAHTIGAYQAEGLEVELASSPGMGKAEAALIDGAVDVLWAGPMRVIKHHDDNPGSPLVCFAEIVCRDPFSIVGRNPNPGFRLADLAQMRFASVSEVPTPWLCLQQDLREAGIDPDRLDRVSDRGMAEISLHCAAAGSRQRSCSSPWSKKRWRRVPGIYGTPRAVADVLPTQRSSRPATTGGHAEPLLQMVRAIYHTQQWLRCKFRCRDS